MSLHSLYACISKLQFGPDGQRQCVNAQRVAVFLWTDHRLHLIAAYIFVQA